MKTKIIIPCIIILATIWYIAYANQDKPVNTDDKFLSDWNKAGIKKLEEKNKKEQAEKLLKEAEAARIEKERLLGISSTGDTWKLQN